MKRSSVTMQVAPLASHCRMEYSPGTLGETMEGLVGMAKQNGRARRVGQRTLAGGVALVSAGASLQPAVAQPAPSSEPGSSSATPSTDGSAGLSDDGTIHVADRHDAEDRLRELYGEEETLEHFLSGSTRFRDMFGLRSDPAYQVDLLLQSESDESISLLLGTPLAEEEDVQVRTQLNIQNELAAAHDSIAAQLGDAFGGLYIDQDVRGRVTINTTRQPAEGQRRTLETLVPSASEIVFTDVQWSSADLVQYQAIFDESYDELRDAGIEFASWGEDVRTNRIAVGVIDLTPDMQGQLENRFDSERVRFYNSSAPQTAYSRFELPLSSGDKIKGTNQYGTEICTAGPYVTGSNGKLRVLTAGHCEDANGGLVDRNWYSPNGANPGIGQAVQNLFQDTSPADVAVLSTSELSGAEIGPNCAYENSGYCRPYEGTKNAVVGAAVLSSGASSGLNGGEVEFQNQQVTYHPAGGPADVRINGISVVDSFAVSGDSGAPVYAKNGNTNKAIFCGVLSGNNAASTRMYYSPYVYIAKYTGVTF